MIADIDVSNRVMVEQGIIGALLVKRDAIHDLPAGFTHAVFRVPAYARAFSAIEVLAKRGGDSSLDASSVATEAGLHGGDAIMVANAWGSAALADLRSNAEKLLDLHRRSDLRAELLAAAKALGEGAPTGDVVGALATRLLDLDAGNDPEVISFRTAASAFLEDLDARKSGRLPPVVKTGLQDLDNLLRIRPGNLVLLAARAHVGKTTLALNIADNIALQKRHVLIHSLEMSDAELVSLAMSRAAGIPSECFTDDSPIRPADYDEMARQMERRTDGFTSDGYLHMNQHYHALGAICRITEKLHRKHGLALVVIDYLQLIEPPNLGKGSNREREVATISRSLKLLARRLGVPVMALCQLNREPDKRNTPQRNNTRQREGEEQKRAPAPKLHDLRESGALEQDADHVMMLHNPFSESKVDHERAHGPFMLSVVKQRLGKRGSVYLRADLEHARFQQHSGTSVVDYVIGRDTP